MRRSTFTYVKFLYLLMATHAVAACDERLDTHMGEDAAALADTDFAIALPKGSRCGTGDNSDQVRNPDQAPGVALGDAGVIACSDEYNDKGSNGFTYSPSYPPGVGYQEEDEENKELPPYLAYLTFDDGPTEWTMDILDILESRNVKGSFFISAKNFKKNFGLDSTYVTDRGDTIVYRNILKRTVEEGHVIGNHTLDHLDLTTLTVDDVQWELDENERLVNVALLRAGAQSRPLTLIRTPYGSPWRHGQVDVADPEAMRAMVGSVVQNRGVNVFWTLDSTDSREWAQGESYTHHPIEVDESAPTYAEKVARIKSSVLEDPMITAGKGAIILFHETHNATRDALSDVIDGLRAVGYSFATVEEYVQMRWGRQSIEATPGPRLYDRCVSDRKRSCFAAGEGAPVVCGRFWKAFEELGGLAVLGKPLGRPYRSPESGALSQVFERGIVELHPEAASPCNVTASPRKAN